MVYTLLKDATLHVVVKAASYVANVIGVFLLPSVALNIDVVRGSYRCAMLCSSCTLPNAWSCTSHSACEHRGDLHRETRIPFVYSSQLATQPEQN